MTDHPSVGEYKEFTAAQKRKILNENRAVNDGNLVEDTDGTALAQPAQHKKGRTPPDNEANVDHIIPRSKGGSNSFSNAKLRSRKNNIKKSDKEE